MSTEEIRTIKEQLEINHKEVIGRLKLLENKVNPVYEIYTSAQGFGKITVWIAKWIFMPAIILLGALLTFKNLTK